MTTPIKLAIVGASSTGKTTLHQHLEKRFKNRNDVVFVHESARQFFNENQVDVPFDSENQKKILALALLNERLAIEKQPNIIVTDTSAIEVAFYTKVNGDEEGAESFLRQLTDYIPTYTKFLLMNPEDVRFENDAIRREDKATRDRIHELLVSFYRERNIPFALISGTIPERQKRVYDTIQSYL